MAGPATAAEQPSLHEKGRSDALPQHTTAPLDTTKDTSSRLSRKAASVLFCSLLCLANVWLLAISSSGLAQLAPWLAPWSSSASGHNSVAWQPCNEHGITVPGFVCGSIRVPKDHFNSSVGSAYIALAKYPATVPRSEKIGSLYLNPGGPGGSGVEFAYGFANTLSKLTLGRYDIIGFDPRGIGRTRPLVNCFGNSQQHELFKAGTVLENGFALPPDPWSKEGKAHLLRQIEELTALQETEYRKCAQTMGEEELRYMNTATVVRDIDSMSKAFDGVDGRINFFGGSYGTILGAYLVNMLPAKRIGRVIIDGVASAPQWANAQTQTWLKDWMVDTDKAFDWFMNDCSRFGPPACRLAKHKGEKPHKIAERIDRFLDALYEEPMAVYNTSRPGLLTSAGARTVLYYSTNRPDQFQPIADAFADAMDEKHPNPKKLYEYLHHPFSPPTSLDQTDLSRAAVVCGDQPTGPAPSAADLLNQTLFGLKHTSRRFAASVAPIEPDGGCQFHPALGRTPERFTGPWNNKLDTPMLIISNTADPITPRASGEEIHKLMGKSSRILIQDSPGHCSLSSVSPCTLGWYRSYLVNGTLPENHFMCKVEGSYFKDPDAEKKAELKEDELLQLAHEIAKAWARFTSGLLLRDY